MLPFISHVRHLHVLVITNSTRRDAELATRDAAIVDAPLSTITTAPLVVTVI
jgi:hypothetical protein